MLQILLCSAYNENLNKTAAAAILKVCNVDLVLFLFFSLNSNHKTRWRAHINLEDAYAGCN